MHACCLDTRCFCRKVKQQMQQLTVAGHLHAGIVRSSNAARAALKHHAAVGRPLQLQRRGQQLLCQRLAVVLRCHACVEHLADVHAIQSTLHSHPVSCYRDNILSERRIKKAPQAICPSWCANRTHGNACLEGAHRVQDSSLTNTMAGAGRQTCNPPASKQQ